MQRASRGMDYEAPHLASDRHRLRECRMPKCSRDTRGDWCNKHHGTTVHKFVRWAALIGKEIGVSLTHPNRIHLEDCLYATKLRGLEEETREVEPCGHCRNRLEKTVRAKMWGDEEALLRLAADVLDVGLAQSPGGDTLHLESCEYLPDDPERWRPPHDEDPAAPRRAKSGCTPCVQWAKEQGAFDVFEDLDP